MADRQVYLAGESTMYRLLREAGQLRARRAERVHILRHTLASRSLEVGGGLADFSDPGQSFQHDGGQRFKLIADSLGARKCLG